MATLADKYVRILPLMDRFGPELTAKTNAVAGTVGAESGKKFGSSMLTSIGGVLAAGAVIGFFKSAFDEAEEAVKIGRLTEAVIKSTGSAAHVTTDQVGDLATSLSNLSGVDDEVVQNAENVLLTFTRVRNEAGKGNDIFNQGTLAALNLSSALGTDLQAASILVGKALNDPVSGLTALKKAGIQFTDAQKEQIKSMVESGHTMDAQKVILRELTAQFGGAAEAAASPADKARVAWGNFEEMVGGKLLPVLNKMLLFGLANQGWLVPLVSAIAALGVLVGVVTVATRVWTAVQGVAKVATAIWTGVQWALDAAFLGFPLVWIIAAVLALIAVVWLIVANWDTIISWLGNAWDWLAAKASSIFHTIIDAIVDAWNTAFEWTRNVFTGIVDKVGQVVDFFQALPGRILVFLMELPSRLFTLGTQMMNQLLFAIGFGIGLVIKEFFLLPGQVWAIIQSLWDTSVAMTTAGVNAVVAYVRTLPGRAAAEFTALWNLATSLFSRGVSSVVGFVATLPGRVVAVFVSTRDGAIAIVTSTVNGVVSWFSQLPGKAVSALSSLAGVVKGALSDAGSWLLDAGRQIIEGLIKGIAGAVGGAVKAAKNAVGSILAGAKSALSIGSPSKVFADQVGRWIPAGIAEGIDRYTSVATDSVAGLSGKLTAGVAAIPSSAGIPMDRVEALLQKVVDAVDRVAPGVGTEINGSVSAMRVVARAR